MKCATLHSESPPVTEKQSIPNAVRAVIADFRASKHRKTGKELRQRHSYTQIPVQVIRDVSMRSGRKKYRDIVAMIWLSIYWDGWKSRDRKKRKKGRLPRKESMITRRMMSDIFGYSESTIKHALNDLLELRITGIARSHKYTGRHGENLGRSYRCPWMENTLDKHRIRVYWGLVTSDTFLSLDITSQAFLIILHIFHTRKANRVQIDYQNLTELGVSKRIISSHINKLSHSGLLVLEDVGKYSFAWMQEGGRYNDGWDTD